MTATLPKLTEREFMDQVTQLARMFGWTWVHFRPARTEHGWRTPVSGPIGKGWPDLLLFRESDGRRMAIELKGDGLKLTPEQARVLGILEACDVESYCFHPADWETIEVVLR